MAATVQPSAEVVGNAFVHQYYLILHQSPGVVHRFYQDASKLGRPEKGGVMSTTTTLQAINEKILSLGYGEYTAEINTVDSQDSHNGGVIVLVTGYLIGSDDVRQKFAQSFFLAPQDKGYFVLNDVFRYVDENQHEKGNQEPINNLEGPITAHMDSSITEENHICEQSEEVNGEGLYSPAENWDVEIEEEEVPVPEVVDEVPSDSQVVVEPNSKIEEVEKKSYASILKVMKDNAFPFCTPAPATSRPIMKSPEQVIFVAPPTPPLDIQVSSSNATENWGTQETEVEGPSIYVKGLPLDATTALLETEFKKFGSIKSNGIQVRCHQRGFCFGFVEFEMASAVQSAIEASPIMIDGCRLLVEEKRSTSRGNNRGRFSSGAGGGYRNDGTRGRGNFGGGKAYNRGEFRTEYGNRGGGRGGFSNRGGGDGYRRGDKMGNNGGRASRNGMTFNSTAKSVSPHVSATA